MPWRHGVGNGQPQRLSARSPDSTNTNKLNPAAAGESGGLAIATGAAGAGSAQARTTPSGPSEEPAGRLSPGALKMIAALEMEKALRTPAQLKIDSQLLYADKMSRGLPVAAGVPVQRVDLPKDGEGRVLVDVKAQVTEGLLGEIGALGGRVINSFPQYGAIRASVPLPAVERLASHRDVRFVSPAARPRLNSEGVDVDGDYAEQANVARSTWGVNGSGVNIGVVSDSVDFMTNSQAWGSLGSVTVLPGQSGLGLGNTGEGTAILEILHTLAPGASLYFASGSASESSFANNILQLRAAGCDIILDDIQYPDESPFQDGPVAKAVNTVTAQGALYFSAAGNAGNQSQGTSGTWEGDFVNGGPASQEKGYVHSYGTTVFNQVTSPGSLCLFWSDPLGASGNDYDIFVLNSTGTTVDASSTNPQNGSQDPFESIASVNQGEQVVIILHSGAARFLHLDTVGGQLSISTAGQIRGHACATNAFAVAAVNVAQTGHTNAFTGGGSVVVENFSSDGPRRMFFNPNGTALTPGNFSSTGGETLPKPDLSGADNVPSDVPFFQPFSGTSAAAPHAAAIAALLKCYDPALPASGIREILTNNALDIESPGWDRDSGYGIVMAPAALSAAPRPPAPAVSAMVPGASGAAGQVYIYGSNLNSVTNVDLGGLTASFETFSNSLIVATVPAGAAGGRLAIASPSGSATNPWAAVAVPVPANNAFSNAAVLSGSAAMVSVNTLSATKEAGEPEHAGNPGGKSVWYRWTAPGAGSFSLDSMGSGFPTLLGVYTGTSVGGLSSVASNLVGGGAFTNLVVFNAAAGVIYQIALDGVDGAGGAAVLRLEPFTSLPSFTNLFTTGFEASEGYKAGQSLAGQKNWQTDGTGGNGVFLDYFTGDGQQAYVGGSTPLPADQETDLWVPLNYAANTSARPLVQFSVLMQVSTSTNGNYDDFGWSVYNSKGDFLIFLDFDNYYNTINYQLDDGNASTPTGVSFENSQSNLLVMTLDFSKNKWSASISGTPVCAGLPLTTLGSPLTLGDIDAGWVVYDTNNPGDNLMVFDNCRVTAGPVNPPQILLGPQSQTVAAGGDVLLSVVAADGAAMQYQWANTNGFIAGATNAILALPGITAAQAGPYVVSVSNPADTVNGAVTASAVVTVTNTPARALFAAPQPNGTGSLSMALTVAPGNHYELQTSTNLITWTALSTFYASSPTAVLLDPSSTNAPYRFYRVVSP